MRTRLGPPHWRTPKPERHRCGLPGKSGAEGRGEYGFLGTQAGPSGPALPAHGLGAGTRVPADRVNQELEFRAREQPLIFLLFSTM